MPRVHQTWSWAVDELVLEDGSHNDDRLDFWEGRSTITEIFDRDCIPRKGDLLIGYLASADGQITTLGNVASIQGISTRRLRVTIRPLLHLPGVSVSTLMARTSKPNADSDSFRGAKVLHPQKLSRRLSDDVLRELAALFEEVVPWLDALEKAREFVSDDIGERLREERDAIQTGLSLTGVQIEGDPLTSEVPDPLAGATSLLNLNLFSDNEDDLVFADLRRFDSEGVITEISASTSKYRDQGVEIWIANLNRKPLEHTLGVDLLYWDRTANSYTLLQYKRLTRTGNSGENDDREWRYRRRKDLEEQLTKMSSLPSHRPEDSDDWRIIGDPFWFKFVRTDAFLPNDRQVLKGMYIPADYLRLAIATDAFRGPQEGFSLGFDNARYLTRDPFIELVQRHYTGSTRATSEDIFRLIQELAPVRDIVLVAKSQLPPNP